MTILVQQPIAEADLKRLRELCDKATQGEWWIDSHGHRMVSMDSFQTVFVAADSMGPAVRHPETGNLSHWPNDWDASYIVAVQPKVVRGLLGEIDRLNALVIERETVRIGQSLQRHDDQKQIDELVAMGIQQDKDEIARLKAENAELKAQAGRSLGPLTLGLRGKAYDQPGTHRAYTYAEQPDNQGAWRLGEALVEAYRAPAGDYIDRGLGLLKSIQQRGFGVFEMDQAMTKAQQA